MNILMFDYYKNAKYLNCMEEEEVQILIYTMNVMKLLAAVLDVKDYGCILME